MKTKTINLYEFSELSEDAKQTAINECRLDFNPWESENKESLKEFCNIFPCSIGRHGLVYNGEIELTGVRLATHIWNNYREQIYKPKQYWICDGRPNTVGLNSKHRDSKIFIIEDGCPLTGFWMDNEILKPIFEFLKKPSANTDFSDLISECYQAYNSAWDRDFEFQTSDEQTIETIESNGYTFTEYGKLEN